ncbi:hypothetical protein [Salinispira pacifica]|nr:hypothetical protein [Salinispira pacifica]
MALPIFAAPWGEGVDDVEDAWNGYSNLQMKISGQIQGFVTSINGGHTEDVFATASNSSSGDIDSTDEVLISFLDDNTVQFELLNTMYTYISDYDFKDFYNYEYFSESNRLQYTEDFWIDTHFERRPYHVRAYFPDSEIFRLRQGDDIRYLWITFMDNRPVLLNIGLLDDEDIYLPYVSVSTYLILEYSYTTSE